MNITPNAAAIIGIRKQTSNINPAAGNRNSITSALNAQNVQQRSIQQNKNDSTPTVYNPNPQKNSWIRNMYITGVKPLYNRGIAGTRTDQIADPIKSLA